MKILSCDPGKDNFAYTVFNEKGKLKTTGMFNNTIDKLTFQDINDNIENFKAEIKKLKINNSHLIIERFIPRSLHKGNLGEITNIQIGILFGKISFNSVYMISASLWKNYFNNENLWVENDSIPEHMLDSIFMGLYYLHKFKHINTKLFKKRLKQISLKDFGYYRYKNEWYYGNRLKEHSRGKKNSFGK